MKLLLTIIFCQIYAFTPTVVAQNSNTALLLEDRKDTTYIRELLSAGKKIENSNIDSALLFYKKASALSEETNFDYGIYRSTHFMAFMFTNQGKFDKAAALLDKFVAFAVKKKNARQEAIAYMEYGTHFGYRGDNQQKIEYYEKALPLFIKINDTASLCVLYGNMAGSFSQKKIYKQAFAYAFQALAINKQNNNMRFLASDYGNLAGIHMDMKNNDSARYYFRQSLVIARSHYFKILEAYSLVNLAYLLRDKQPDTAVLLASQALELNKQAQFVTGIIRSTLELANAHTTKKNPAKAIELLNGLLPDTTQMGLEEKTLFAQAFYTAYKGSINYQKAIEANEQWLVLNDSAQSEATRQSLLDFSRQVEALNHEKSLLLKEAHISKQKNQIIWLSIGLIAAAICAFLFVLYHRARQQAKNKTIETLKKEKELAQVNVQLDGLKKERERISREIHDEIGTSLTSISLLTQVLQKKPGNAEQPELKKITDTTAEMVKQLNEIIWSLNSGNDTVNSLLAYLHRFAEGFLTENSIELQYQDMPLETDKPLEGVIRQHIFLTAKEAIHNIVRHSGATQSVIAVTAQNGLHINIKDNGRGIDFNNLPPFRNGLTNMKQRMEAIGGKLLIDNNGGTQVSIVYNVLPA
jgi:signal transduction histidine kinase